MIVESDLKKLFNELRNSEATNFTLKGFNITIKVVGQESKLLLATPVYHGGNYIPKSVRNCVSQKSPFDQSFIKTYLTIDENQFQISLNYLGNLDHLTSHKFKDLLEEFSILAEEWSFFLDEHDKNDLIHVRVK